RSPYRRTGRPTRRRLLPRLRHLPTADRVDPVPAGQRHGLGHDGPPAIRAAPDQRRPPRPPPGPGRSDRHRDGQKPRRPLPPRPPPRPPAAPPAPDAGRPPPGPPPRPPPRRGPGRGPPRRPRRPRGPPPNATPPRGWLPPAGGSWGPACWGFPCPPAVTT